MIVMGVMYILMGFIGISLSNEARTLPFSESKKCVKHGNFWFTIGIIALLIGLLLMIACFMLGSAEIGK